MYKLPSQLDTVSDVFLQLDDYVPICILDECLPSSPIPDCGDVVQHSLQVNMERALNARSMLQTAHAFLDFGNLLQHSLQVIMGRALNARSIHQIAHAFPDLGNLLQHSLQVDMERALNARSMHQIVHDIPEFGNIAALPAG